MTNPTDTNQASEDELREQLADKLEWYSRYRERGQDDDMDRAFDGILAFIRTEKLKLLAEVRERVVGEDEKPDSLSANKNSKKNLRPMYKNQLRAEQRIALTQLEAEL